MTAYILLIMLTDQPHPSYINYNYLYSLSPDIESTCKIFASYHDLLTSHLTVHVDILLATIYIIEGIILHLHMCCNKKLQKKKTHLETLTSHIYM